MSRVFNANSAVREQVPLLIGIVSPSGGGKTYSALRLATGIQRACPGEIVLIDTENRRALHYADQFTYTHIPFAPPFNPLDYLEVIRFAAARTPAVIIVDSMTHEHTGEGGYLDTAERTIDRMAGDDWAKREKVKFAGWAKVGPMRTTLIEGIKQISGNFIFCWRGKEKTKPITNSKGRMEVVQMGLMAVGGEDWIYEMTINCLLQPRSDGKPDWTGTEPGERLHMKLPQQFRGLFKPGTQLSEELGEAMARWAIGGIPSSPSPSSSPSTSPSLSSSASSPPSPPASSSPSPLLPPLHISGEFPVARERQSPGARQQLWDDLDAAANYGYAAFAGAYNKAFGKGGYAPQDPDFRNAFREHRDHWIAIANEVDMRTISALPKVVTLGPPDFKQGLHDDGFTHDPITGEVVP